MKRFNYIYLFLTIAAFSSCKKDLSSEGVSRVTNYPIIVKQGDFVETVLAGSTFTDPGVKAYENGKEITLVTKGSVDTNTPGAYILNYSAQNKDGYWAYDSRIVGVITNEAAADNLSGSYQRTAGVQGTAVWTKIKDGVYLDSDVGGAKLDASVYVINIKKGIVVVPNQPLSGGGSDAYCTNASGTSEIAFTNGPIGSVCYNWVVINGGYGTSLRSFVKVN